MYIYTQNQKINYKQMEFGVEAFRETFNGGLVANLVLELKIVAFVAILVDALYYYAVSNILGKRNSIFVILLSSKYFVWFTVR